MIDLAQVLFSKYEQKQLAHFYILSTANSENMRGELLDNWMRNFLLKVIMHEKGLSEEGAKNVLMLGHGDILEIRKENPQDRYVVEDFEELIYFQNYYNFEFSHRFAIVYNAQHITEIVANKLLKTLEEPRPGSTTFFLNSSGQNFLPTIRSRAIELKLPAQSEKSAEEENIFFNNRNQQISWLKKQSQARSIAPELIDQLISLLSGLNTPQEFLTNKKIEKDEWNKLFVLMLDLANRSPVNYQHNEKLREELQWFQRAQVFNQPNWERFLGLGQSIGLLRD